MIDLTVNDPFLLRKTQNGVKQDMVDGDSGSNDNDGTIPPLRHQCEGGDSSDKEDDGMYEEYSGPVFEPTVLCQGTRVRSQAKYLVPTHTGQSYDQGVSFHQVSHLKVSKGNYVRDQFAGAGYSTKKGVLHFNFNEDTPCPTEMTEEQSDAYIVGVILAHQYSLEKGLELFDEKIDTAVTKELTQIHNMETYEPVDPKTMTYAYINKALASLLFIT